jgi:hypothetical protein
MVGRVVEQGWSLAKAAEAAGVSERTCSTLRPGDVLETRHGVCRVGLPIARELARSAPRLRAAVAPHAEALGRELLRSPDHPTPLTRARHRKALALA